MQESSLHAAMKTYIASKDGEQEVIVDGFQIDVVRDNVLIEVQTANFSALKPKLQALLKNYELLLVYPVSKEKWISKLPSEGFEPLYRRKSPKKGRTVDIFKELIFINSFLSDSNLKIKLVFICEEEIRRDDGKGSWRRKGVSIIDRRLLSVQGEKLLIFPHDYVRLLPKNLPSRFTNKQLARELQISTTLARKMTYTLRSIGILALCGKQRNELLFEIVQE